MSPERTTQAEFIICNHPIIKRWFRSGTLWVKEECVWQHHFRSFADARTAIQQWIVWS